MKIINVALITYASIFILSGCKESAPACSDQETTDLVLKISREELAKQAMGGLAPSESEIDEIIKNMGLKKLSLNAIRTTDQNKETGAQECAAQLTMTFNNDRDANVDITYKSEKSDNGKEFYVTVEGL